MAKQMVNTEAANEACPLAQRIKQLLVSVNLRELDLSRHLGISAMALSRTWKKPAHLRAKLEQIAQFLNMKPEELVAGDDDSAIVRAIHAAQLKAQDDQSFPGGLRLVRLREGESRRGQWAFLGAPVMIPVTGTVVATKSDTGWCLWRYSQAAATDHIILSSVDNPRIPPVVYAVDDAPEIRVVLMIGTTQAVGEIA